jgi:hypothetical protein
LYCLNNDRNNKLFVIRNLYRERARAIIFSIVQKGTCQLALDVIFDSGEIATYFNGIVEAIR